MPRNTLTDPGVRCVPKHGSSSIAVHATDSASLITHTAAPQSGRHAPPLAPASTPPVLTKLLAEDKLGPTDGRHVAIIDRKGNIGVYTGPNATKWAGDRQGKNWTVQGSPLAGPRILEAMGKAWPISARRSSSIRQYGSGSSQLRDS